MVKKNYNCYIMQEIVITLVIVYNYYFIHELLRKRLQFQDYELKCDLKKIMKEIFCHGMKL